MYSHEFKIGAEAEIINDRGAKCFLMAWDLTTAMFYKVHTHNVGTDTSIELM